MSRFLLACGGTGGHLAPGIALAEVLLERGHACRLLVSGKAVDARLSRKYDQLDFVAMPGTGFSLRPVRLARFLSSQAKAVGFAASIVRRWLPDAVVGFGGFLTAAVAVAARASRVPVVLHEANRVPGRAIRMTGALARRVYLPPGVEPGRLRAGIVRACGLPVRREFVPRPAGRARTALGLEPGLPVVAVLGGSQGARALDAWARQCGPRLAAEGIQVAAISGPGRGGGEGLRSHPGPGGRAVQSLSLSFCDDMPGLLSASDLAVSRAGAGTLAELVRMRVPAVLVPFPHAADNHQEHNARWFEKQGGGFVLDQRFIGDLAREVVAMIRNERLREQFRQNLARMDRDDAARFVADDLDRLLRGAEAPPLSEVAASP
jgi:UDP-N-acetylglucosamine--N-acetylmuramyl-(pentapeptide) pyrophosphoryl-undecaprenol N-acetylglucosamine transferase